MLEIIKLGNGRLLPVEIGIDIVYDQENHLWFNDLDELISFHELQNAQWEKFHSGDNTTTEL